MVTFAEDENESQRILLEATQLIDAVYHIRHSTIQIENTRLHSCILMG